MARTARPSDIYRLPEQTAQSPRPVAPPQGDPPPGRRVPVWLWVAVAMAIVLVASGLLGGGTAPSPTADAPLVDIISEDQAIAALALYGAQADTIGQLRDREEIFSGGGPAAAAGVARRGAAAVQRTLDAARDVNNPDSLFTDYVGNGEHIAAQQRLTDAAGVAETIGVLAATHDAMYGGSGGINLNEAQTHINGVINTGLSPGPLDRWGEALLSEMENRPSLDAALAGREECAQYWTSMVSFLQPAAVPQLQSYVSGLPAVTVDGLRGHPVAGPALETLEETSREVSTGTTSPSGRR